MVNRTQAFLIKMFMQTLGPSFSQITADITNNPEVFNNSARAKAESTIKSILKQYGITFKDDNDNLPVIHYLSQIKEIFKAKSEGKVLIDGVNLWRAEVAKPYLVDLVSKDLTVEQRTIEAAKILGVEKISEVLETINATIKILGRPSETGEEFTPDTNPLTNTFVDWGDTLHNYKEYTIENYPSENKPSLH